MQTFYKYKLKNKEKILIHQLVLKILFYLNNFYFDNNYFHLAKFDKI